MMWGLNVNFLSKIISRNLCYSTIGILVESSLNTGILCILWRLQKCEHCVLLLENLKPFLIVQLFILFRDCWSWRSIVLICFDLQQIRKSSMYSEPLTPKFKHFTMLFILYWIRSQIGCYLVALPFLVLVVLRVLCRSVLGIFNHLRSFYKIGQSTLQSHIFQVFDYAIFLRSVVGFFYIKKYGYHMFFFGKSFSYEGFQVDKVINYTSCFSKACLKVCD